MGTKLCVAKVDQICKAGRPQTLSRGELGFASLARKLVPGTNRKAIVATVNAVSHSRAQIPRNWALVLDCQVGNAAPRIELVRCGKCRGRTNVETGTASAAAVVFRRICREFERRKNCAEKKPRSVLARDQVCVFALPPQASARGKRLFHHRGRIDEYFHVTAGIGREPARQFLQSRFDQFVVVVASGIDRDSRAIMRLQDRKRV